jgi:hypothetical protein
MARFIPFVLICLICCCCAAQAQPVIIPRLGTTQHDPDQTFSLVKSYLSDPLKGGLFSIIRADSATHLLVAKRGGIDTRNWSDWAYCKLSPSHMLDNLEDGTAEVKVKISRAGINLSNVSVSADFQGTYGLAGNQTTAQCVSKGVLENAILKAVGAMPESQ